MSVKTYRKRPVEIQAIQYKAGIQGNIHELMLFAGKAIVPYEMDANVPGTLAIETMEGRMLLRPNAFVVKGVKGEFYAVDEEVFPKTYMVLCDYCHEVEEQGHSWNCHKAYEGVEGYDGEDNE